MDENKAIALHYVGNGAYVPGVPACDMSASDVAASGFALEALLALCSGDAPLYVIDESGANASEQKDGE